MYLNTPKFPLSPILDCPQAVAITSFGRLGVFALDLSHTRVRGDLRPHESTHILPSSQHNKKVLGEVRMKRLMLFVTLGCWEDHTS